MGKFIPRRRPWRFDYVLLIPILPFCTSLRFSVFRFRFVHLVFFVFLDVLISGIWSDAAALEDPLLCSLVPDLLDLQLGSRAPSTLTNYKSGWWDGADGHLRRLVFLSFRQRPLHIALFAVTELTNVCLENNTGVSPPRSCCLWHEKFDFLENTRFKTLEQLLKTFWNNLAEFTSTWA